MGIHYSSRLDTDEAKADLNRKIYLAKETLKQLQTAACIFGESTTGDGEFDVELTVALNVARAALLRLQAMLIEQSGSSNLRFEEPAAPIYHFSF